MENKSESKLIFITVHIFFTDDKESYNGAVEAATTLTGALVVFLIGFVNINWKVWGNLAIVLMTGFTSILLYIMGISDNIWMAYSGKH